MAKRAANRTAAKASTNPGAQLERIANLLALVAIKDLPEEGDRIALLAGAGYSYGEIGALLGKKSDAVRMMLARNSRSGRKKRRG